MSRHPPEVSNNQPTERPVSDCPEPFACYVEGYAVGKDKAYFETIASLDCPPHAEGCACQPCQVKRARLQKVMTLMTRTSPGVRTSGSLGAGGSRQPALKRRPFPRKCRRRDTQVHDTGRGLPGPKILRTRYFRRGLDEVDPIGWTGLSHN